MTIGNVYTVSTDAQQNNNTTTFATINQLSFPIRANQKFGFTYCILCRPSPLNPTGIKFQWVGPANFSVFYCSAQFFDPNAGGPIAYSNTTLQDIDIPDASGVQSVLQVSGAFYAGNLSGLFNIQFAQSASFSNSVTIMPGSYATFCSL